MDSKQTQALTSSDTYEAWTRLWCLTCILCDELDFYKKEPIYVYVQVKFTPQEPIFRIPQDMIAFSDPVSSSHYWIAGNMGGGKTAAFYAATIGVSSQKQRISKEIEDINAFQHNSSDSLKETFMEKNILDKHRDELFAFIGLKPSMDNFQQLISSSLGSFFRETPCSQSPFLLAFGSEKKFMQVVNAQLRLNSLKRYILNLFAAYYGWSTASISQKRLMRKKQVVLLMPIGAKHTFQWVRARGSNKWLLALLLLPTMKEKLMIGKQLVAFPRVLLIGIDFQVFQQFLFTVLSNMKTKQLYEPRFFESSDALFRKTYERSSQNEEKLIDKKLLCCVECFNNINWRTLSRDQFATEEFHRIIFSSSSVGKSDFNDFPGEEGKCLFTGSNR